MCTVVLLLRPGHAWPVLLAANRDERLDRTWDRPGAWWPDRPGLIAGRDRSGGGTWMAMEGSRVAAVLNRTGSLGPAPGKTSRGTLPLLAASGGVDAIAALDAGGYRSFNLVVADATGAWFVKGTGAGSPEAWPLAPGLHMITAHDPNDLDSPRTRMHLPRFAAAPPPDPAAGDWAAWQTILSDRIGPRAAALNVPDLDGFGTVCSSFVGIPAAGLPVWLFAAGPPDRAPFYPVALTAAGPAARPAAAGPGRTAGP